MQRGLSRALSTGEHSCHTVCRDEDGWPEIRTALILPMRVINLFRAVLQFLTSSRFFLEICDTKELSAACSQQADQLMQFSLLHDLMFYQCRGSFTPKF